MAAPDMVKKVSDTQPIDGIRAYIRSEQEKWGSLVRTLGLAGSQ